MCSFSWGVRFILLSTNIGSLPVLVGLHLLLHELRGQIHLPELLLSKTLPKWRTHCYSSIFFSSSVSRRKTRNSFPLPSFFPFVCCAAYKLTDYVCNISGAVFYKKELSLVVVPRGSRVLGGSLPLIHGSRKEEPDKTCLPKNPTGQSLKDKLAT